MQMALMAAGSSYSTATLLQLAGLLTVPALLAVPAVALPAIPHPCHFDTLPRTVLIPDGPGTTGWVWTEPFREVQYPHPAL